MSFDHQVTCIVNGNEEKKINLYKSKIALYDYSIRKIEGYYDTEIVELFNYMINTYIISTEKISKWLEGEESIDDFDYLDEEMKNHKILLKTLQLCDNLKCNIGSNIISKLISESILKTQTENISDLVNFDDVE